VSLVFSIAVLATYRQSGFVASPSGFALKPRHSSSLEQAAAEKLAAEKAAVN